MILDKLIISSVAFILLTGKRDKGTNVANYFIYDDLFAIFNISVYKLIFVKLSQLCFSLLTLVSTGYAVCL